MIGSALTQFAQYVHAVFAGHHDTQYDQIERVYADHLQAMVAVVSSCHAKDFRAQKTAHQFA